MSAFLAINLHRPIDDGCPTVALVDQALLSSAQKARWLTSTGSEKPMRSIYDASLKRARLESLARWVWVQTRGTEPPTFIGHVNHDLLDCTEANLVSLRHAGAGRSGKTGAAVQTALDAAGMTGRAVRAALGLAAEGEPKQRGRDKPFTDDQAAELVRLRAENASMPLVRFNNEIVAEVVGKKLGHRMLVSLFKP